MLGRELKYLPLFDANDQGTVVLNYTTVVELVET